MLEEARRSNIYTQTFRVYGSGHPVVVSVSPQSRDYKSRKLVLLARKTGQVKFKNLEKIIKNIYVNNYIIYDVFSAKNLKRSIFTDTKK
jgi:hypothetical protein